MAERAHGIDRRDESAIRKPAAPGQWKSQDLNARLTDVQRVYRFLAIKNALAAKESVKAIRLSVKIPEQQPDIGRPIEEIESEYREWSIPFGISGYVALYLLA